MSWDSLLQPVKTFYRYLRNRWGSEHAAGNHRIVTMDPTSNFHRQQIVLLDHIISVKTADLIYRMENKSTSVPLNLRKYTPHRDVPVMIYGKDLVSWFMANMDITPNEALYLANLLASHPVLFDITNHYCVTLNFGFFHRYPVAHARNVSMSIIEADAIMDYEYVSYLCLKKMRLNIHGGLEDYEIENSAKLYVDLTKWKFEFIQAVPLINS